MQQRGGDHVAEVGDRLSHAGMSQAILQMLAGRLATRDHVVFPPTLSAPQLPPQGATATREVRGCAAAATGCGPAGPDARTLPGAAPTTPSPATVSHRSRTPS